MSWFENWFDSKYYHILYNNRDDSEAIFLINNILLGAPLAEISVEIYVPACEKTIFNCGADVYQVLIKSTIFSDKNNKCCLTQHDPQSVGNLTHRFL